MTILDEVRSPALPPRTAAPVDRAPAQPAAGARLTATGSFSTRLVTKLGDLLLSRTSRRGFLATSAVVGAAVVTAPKTYALTPTSAYQSICGPGNTCSSGWTAMCCTINAGKNTCPPGSLAGGWWKADGSGFCCGGARYYIDCHYTCSNCSTGCGGYKSYCKAGCHPGSCTCATGDCDTRRTNCNYFRYGQCNTQIPCTGPVLCRVISCTPPWKQFNCTSSAATDNRTALHSASCLPGQGCLPTIDQWWWDQGGPGSPVGNTVDPAVAQLANGVTRRNFASGMVYHSAQYGIVIISSPFRELYRDLGSQTSPLGLATGNQYAYEGGVIQNFEGGAMYYLPNQAGPTALWGASLERFRRLGDVRGLGWPKTMNQAVPGGVRDITTNARIYTTSAGASYVVNGATLAKYIELGETGGSLGFPTSGPKPVTLKHFVNTPGGQPMTYRTTFQHGWIEAGPSGVTVGLT